MNLWLNWQLSEDPLLLNAISNAVFLNNLPELLVGLNMCSFSCQGVKTMEKDSLYWILVCYERCTNKLRMREFSQCHSFIGLSLWSPLHFASLEFLTQRIPKIRTRIGKCTVCYNFLPCPPHHMKLITACNWLVGNKYFVCPITVWAEKKTWSASLFGNILYSSHAGSNKRVQCND